MSARHIGSLGEVNPKSSFLSSLAAGLKGESWTLEFSFSCHIYRNMDYENKEKKKVLMKYHTTHSNRVFLLILNITAAFHETHSCINTQFKGSESDGSPGFFFSLFLNLFSVARQGLSSIAASTFFRRDATHRDMAPKLEYKPSNCLG